MAPAIMLSSGKKGAKPAIPVGGSASLRSVGDGVCSLARSDRRYKLDLPTTHESMPVAFCGSRIDENHLGENQPPAEWI